jgi:hypothetical protein
LWFAYNCYLAGAGGIPERTTNDSTAPEAGAGCELTGNSFSFHLRCSKQKVIIQEGNGRQDRKLPATEVMRGGVVAWWRATFSKAQVQQQQEVVGKSCPPTAQKTMWRASLSWPTSDEPEASATDLPSNSYFCFQV